MAELKKSLRGTNIREIILLGLIVTLSLMSCDSSNVPAGFDASGQSPAYLDVTVNKYAGCKADETEGGVKVCEKEKSSCGARKTLDGNIHIDKQQGCNTDASGTPPRPLEICARCNDSSNSFSVSCPEGKLYFIDCIPCPAGMVVSGNDCVIIEGDKNNCGKPGNVCTSNKVCKNGVCVCPRGTFQGCANTGLCGMLCNDGSRFGICAGGSSFNAEQCLLSYQGICWEHGGVKNTCAYWHNDDFNSGCGYLDPYTACN